MISILAAILAGLLSAPHSCPRPDWCVIHAHPYRAIDIIRNPVSGSIVYSYWNPATWEIE